MTPEQSSYLARQTARQFKSGELVRLTRESTDGEGGWDNTWDDEGMSALVGQIGIVKPRYHEVAYDNIGIPVDFPDETGYYFPHFVLERINPASEPSPTPEIPLW